MVSSLMSISINPEFVRTRLELFRTRTAARDGSRNRKCPLAFLGLFTAPLDFENILLAFPWQFTAPLDFERILLAFLWRFYGPVGF